MIWLSYILLGCEEKETSEPVNTLEPTDTAEVQEPCDTQIWYLDADGDEFGDPFGAMESCEPLEGYVQNNEDCDDGNPQAYPDQVWYLDADGDGYGSLEHTLIQCTQPPSYIKNAEDCDDLDSTKNPESVWYLDEDGDGFGDPLSQIASCLATETSVANASDCDDENIDIHPDASEECDYIDNDCDGLMDNEDPSLNEYGEVAIYTDADGDGFGIDEYVTHACPSSPLGSPITGDCDDDDPNIFPGNFEWPDEIDSNCDDDAFFQNSNYFTHGFTYTSSLSGNKHLSSVDINEDGVLDLLVGVPDETGRIFWLDGTTSADFQELDGTTNAWTGTQESAFGTSVAVVGDMNGDGSTNILIGAPEEGAVYLFDANTPGAADEALWHWQVDEIESQFGMDIISLGDIDADGSPEALVSALGYDGTNNNRGGVFLLHATQIGNNNNPAHGMHITGLGNGDAFGKSMANISDIDGDGIVEIAVTASKTGPQNDGTIYVFNTSVLASGTVDLENTIRFYGQPFQQAGTQLQGIGDFNGDGHQDFVIKAGSIWGSSTELGTLYVIFGASTFAQENQLVDASLQINSEATGNDFGERILSQADINADGFDDLVFANPLADYPIGSGNNNHGFVFGLLGGTMTGTHLITEVADVALSGKSNWQNFGTGLVNAGDVDEDGQADFWVSSVNEIFLFTSDVFSQ